MRTYYMAEARRDIAEGESQYSVNHGLMGFLTKVAASQPLSAQDEAARIIWQRDLLQRIYRNSIWLKVMRGMAALPESAKKDGLCVRRIDRYVSLQGISLGRDPKRLLSDVMELEGVEWARAIDGEIKHIPIERMVDFVFADFGSIGAAPAEVSGHVKLTYDFVILRVQ